tara:strand:- start:6139 stop:6798 length:660 start_codon:yes stop_codon:yes gene_type:complete
MHDTFVMLNVKKSQVMKKVIKKSILMGVMLTTLLSNATNEGSSFIPKKEKDISRTMVTINDVKKGQKLVIKDVNGFVLYKELLKEAGIYTKTFDLTELPDGDYVFELDKDLQIKTIPFSVFSNEVTFDKEKETTIYKPYIRLKDNYIYINKLALNEAPLDVKIYYSGDSNTGYNELIYSETIKNTKSIGKVYKLLKDAPGKYSVELSSDNRTYQESFTL